MCAQKNLTLTEVSKAQRIESVECCPNNNHGASVSRLVTRCCCTTRGHRSYVAVLRVHHAGRRPAARIGFIEHLVVLRASIAYWCTIAVLHVCLTFGRLHKGCSGGLQVAECCCEARSEAGPNHRPQNQVLPAVSACACIMFLTMRNTSYLLTAGARGCHYNTSLHAATAQASVPSKASAAQRH